MDWGCAGINKGIGPAGSKEQLKNTAKEYWKLRMEGKYDDTYKMEDENKLPDLNDYRNKVTSMRRISIVSYEVKDVHVEDDSGTANVEFSFIMPPVTKPFKKTFEDRWVYRDSEWRHVLPE